MNTGWLARYWKNSTRCTPSSSQQHPEWECDSGRGKLWKIVEKKLTAEHALISYIFHITNRLHTNTHQQTRVQCAFTGRTDEKLDAREKVFWKSRFLCFMQSEEFYAKLNGYLVRSFAINIEHTVQILTRTCVHLCTCVCVRSAFIHSFEIRTSFQFNKFINFSIWLAQVARARDDVVRTVLVVCKDTLLASHSLFSHWLDDLPAGTNGNLTFGGWLAVVLVSNCSKSIQQSLWKEIVGNFNGLTKVSFSKNCKQKIKW